MVFTLQLGLPKIARFLLLVALAALSTLAALESEAQSSNPSETCVELLAGISAKPSSSPPLSEESKKQLEKVKAELVGQKDAVVYAPFTSQGKVSFARLEAVDLAGSKVEEKWYASQLNPVEFKRWVYSGRIESNSFARSKLASLMPDTQSSDLGKVVLFLDNGTYKLNPASFGRPGAIVLGSGSVKRALDSYRSLQLSTIKSDSVVSGIFGLPESELDYTNTFGVSPSPQARFGALETWRKAAEDTRQVVDEHRTIKVIAGLGQAPESKSTLLERIEKSDGIVMIIAHSDGAALRLPSGEAIQITPEDILHLRLTKNPFVFLRVCSGAEDGFAHAFLKAGARAVWANTGPMDVTEAVDQVRLLLRSIRPGQSWGDAMASINSSKPNGTNNTILFAELLNRKVDGNTYDSF